MLLQVTQALTEDFQKGCAHERVFGSKALTALRAYGTDAPQARFYLCREADQITASLYLANGVLVVSASEQCDAAEIAALARREQVCEIDTNWAQCAQLQRLLGGTTESSYYMEYRGGAVQGTFDDMAPGEPCAVFSVLQRSHEYYRTHLEFTGWLADLQRRLDKGLSTLYQLQIGGEVIGTGSIVSQDDRCAVIAAVAVVPEHRHRGYGAHISRFLTARILEMGKTPRLISGYDEVAALYEQIGFSAYGRWGELYL